MAAFQFKSVQVFKDQSLGIGSFGAVCKAKCDDLLCAAKIIHPTLFDPTLLHQIAPQIEHRLPIRRFEQECEFMSAIRHPNIVQYLGMFRDTDTHLPVLLMELMDSSLTYFLENSTQLIPYHVQINCCHDITLALSFLHSNDIVHRDLSSNNVLLRGNIMAKVTDFGMARLGEINPQATHFTNTMCPGTDVYMPPEAVQDKPVYTDKIDCFSFGVILIQILTREFPNPGDRLRRIELQHSELPTGSVLVEVSEVSRRQNHISQIPPKHSLLPIALHCLKDKDSERPSAHELCERVADLKGTPKYRDSAKTVQEEDEATLSQEMEKKCTTSSKEEEIHRLRRQLQQYQELDQDNKQQIEEREIQLGQQLRQLQQEHDQILSEKSKLIEEKERELEYVKQQLEASEHVVAQLERQIAELEQQSRNGEQQEMIASSGDKELISVNMRWRRGKNAPCGIYRQCDAVVKGNTVYIRKENSITIFSYDFTTDSWSQLPVCAYENGSIAIVNGWLTTIGGCILLQCTNELFSLTGEGNDRRWIKKFPPMPTKRIKTTAICPEGSNALIVAGGRRVNTLATVEVMNTESNQWSTVADLLEPICYSSATVCKGQLYLLGGKKNDHSPTWGVVYTCSVSDLIQSSNSTFAKLFNASVWKKVANLPFVNSTCETFHGKLLAVGGYSFRTGATTAVFAYNSITNSWNIISHMKSALSECFTAVLPDNQLMVVGGKNTLGVTDKVEFASMCK